MDESYRAAVIMLSVVHCQGMIAAMVAENEQAKIEGKRIPYDYNSFANEVAYMEQRYEAMRL